MATVITASNPGSWTRRCDEHCHSAEKPECDCICGGRYHGAKRKAGGLVKAIENTSMEDLAALGFFGPLFQQQEAKNG